MGDRTISANKTNYKWVGVAADNSDMLKHLPHWLLFSVGVLTLGLAMILSPNEAVSRSDVNRNVTSAIDIPGQSAHTQQVSLTLSTPQNTKSPQSPLVDNEFDGTNTNIVELDEPVESSPLVTAANVDMTTDTLVEDAPLLVASINPSMIIAETEAANIADLAHDEEETVDDHISALIEPAALEDPDLKSVKVKNGDSLALILDRMGVSPRQVYDLVSVGEETAPLTRLHPGDVLNVSIGKNGELKQLKYELDHERTLDVRKQLGEFDALIIYHDLERRIKSSTGVIQSSLFLAAKRAGLSTNLTMELASIFGWDIDFVLDIRAGDRFTVLYEEIFRDGEKIRDGNIIAAEFINQGKIHRAFRYTDSENRTAYYTPEGRSLRSTFLRTPIEFARVSSKFNLKRKHPVLNRIRAHKGVDYAAPTGTAIRATADGKVIFRGRKGGYGKAIILQHGNKYTTLYAHLSNFKKGVTSGRSVKQGDVIGYVGKTGLATGPHLHYEFRVDGVHRNPLTVKLPSAEPLKQAYLADFKSKTQSAIAKLDSLSETAVASVNN